MVGCILVLCNSLDCRLNMRKPQHRESGFSLSGQGHRHNLQNSGGLGQSQDSVLWSLFIRSLHILRSAIQPNGFLDGLLGALLGRMAPWYSGAAQLTGPVCRGSS
jgi:hypothetical protein